MSKSNLNNNFTAFNASLFGEVNNFENLQCYSWNIHNNYSHKLPICVFPKENEIAKKFLKPVLLPEIILNNKDRISSKILKGLKKDIKKGALSDVQTKTQKLYSLARECVGKEDKICQMVLRKAFIYFWDKDLYIANRLAIDCIGKKNEACQSIVKKYSSKSAFGSKLLVIAAVVTIMAVSVGIINCLLSNPPNEIQSA